MIKRPLDYEKQQTYNLTIKAQNSRYSGQLGAITQKITVTVVNRNEHAPKFHFDVQTVNIFEGTPIGENVTTCEAIDLDLHPEQDLTYSLLTTPNSELFHVAKHTGIVRVAKGERH